MSPQRSRTVVEPTVGTPGRYRNPKSETRGPREIQSVKQQGWDFGFRIASGGLGLDFPRRKLSKFLGFALVVACLLATSFGGERGLPAQHGIGNFGRVNERLYRGAQPDESGLQQLKRLGIKSIVNLRTMGEAPKEEAALAGALGLVYTNVPLSGIRKPKDEQVRRALALLESLPAPIFVHCQHGCDRTGTIVACYRIQREGWSNQAALLEAQRHGLSKLERGMKRYILRFGKGLNAR